MRSLSGLTLALCLASATASAQEEPPVFGPSGSIRGESLRELPAPRPPRAGPYGLDSVAQAERSKDPVREAYQEPNAFRTPNPTPLERVPAPVDPGIASDDIIGREGQPHAPLVAPAAPLPPFAPLVNVRLTDTHLAASKDQIGINDFDLHGTLAAGTTGIMITPGYGMHFINGPKQTDLPETLYDIYVDLRYSKKFDDNWAIELALTPSFYSDLDNNTGDAWRFITTVLGYYNVHEGMQFMAGVMYLDRFDINWFPVFGLIYTGDNADSDFRYEFVFPRPKFARRVSYDGCRAGWAYLQGEFGGGAWAVQRQTGADDMIAYRDWRIMLGYESKVKDFSSPSWFGEVGYVFNRQLEYESGIGDFDPTACGMVRMGVWY